MGNGAAAERTGADIHHTNAHLRLARIAAREGNDLEAAEHLDEALQLVASATAAQPKNGAYLDTAAEVHFRRGEREQAVALESKALQIEPDNTFMKEQLARFQQGK